MHIKNKDVTRSTMATLREILYLLTEAEVTLQRIAAETEDADGSLFEAERLLRDIAFVSDLLPQAEIEILLNAIGSIYLSLEDQKASEQRPRSMQGCPCIINSEEQLSLLLSFDLKLTDIASMLQVSTSTVRRQIIQFGLGDEVNFSIVTDAQLDHVANQFSISHPNSGEKSFEGYLRHMGMRVQRSHIRSSLQRIDPRCVRNRFHATLHRRQYCVPMPNSLWHIDGYHKLIRWRVIIHGGIDGFSRLPVYLTKQFSESTPTANSGRNIHSPLRSKSLLKTGCKSWLLANSIGQCGQSAAHNFQQSLWSMLLYANAIWDKVSPRSIPEKDASVLWRSARCGDIDDILVWDTQKWTTIND